MVERRASGIPSMAQLERGRRMGSSLTNGFLEYAERLHSSLKAADWSAIERLCLALRSCWRDGRRVFLCGNGGSAANAMHMANDLAYGIGRRIIPGLRAQALPANVTLLTCLANDEGYADIFSRQLAVEGQSGDVLIVFSGSGNSPNILKVLEQASVMRIQSFAILGFSGGKAKSLADLSIHFAVDDMQISEDLQLVVCHMIMQWLCRVGPQEAMG
jgi:D-sedoheptulose 7-phosphate isomerase